MQGAVDFSHEIALVEAAVGYRLSGRSILDVGCGDGALSRALARRGNIVHAFDVDPVAIHRASEASHSHGVRYWQGSAFDLATMPDAASAYDVVYLRGCGALNTADHSIALVGDLLSALRERLTAQGIIVISENSDFSGRTVASGNWKLKRSGEIRDIYVRPMLNAGFRVRLVYTKRSLRLVGPRVLVSAPVAGALGHIFAFAGIWTRFVLIATRAPDR